MEYINLKNGYTKNDIIKIVEIIKSGGILIVPTDTVYGIIADSMNEKAIKKIYDLKQRDISKPVNILVSNFDMIKNVTSKISEEEEKIIKRFFPGPITIILDRNEKIPSIVTAGLKTIGVRMPENKLLMDIIEFLRKTYCCN